MLLSATRERIISDFLGSAASTTFVNVHLIIIARCKMMVHLKNFCSWLFKALLISSLM